MEGCETRSQPSRSSPSIRGRRADAGAPVPPLRRLPFRTGAGFRSCLVALALAAGSACAGVACATAGSPLVPDPADPQRLRHPRLGYGIADARRIDPAWEAVPLEGADLAFRRGASTWMVATRCRPTRANARVLAHQLLIGLRERRIREEGPVAVDGEPGWRQEVEAVDGEGRSVRLETITSRLGECVVDWVRVAPPEAAPRDDDFAAWWRTFRRPAEVPDPLRGTALAEEDES